MTDITAVSDINDSYEEVIKKVADNHVVVEKNLYDKAGKAILVKTESYGSNRIKKEKEGAQKAVAYWTDVVVATELTKAQGVLSKVEAIETVMEGAIK